MIKRSNKSVDTTDKHNQNKNKTKCKLINLFYTKINRKKIRTCRARFIILFERCLQLMNVFHHEFDDSNKEKD